jgi:hypothetical protein
MRNLGLKGAIFISVVIALTGCSKESTANNTINDESLIEAPVQEVAASGVFGTAVKSKDGVTSEVSNPTKFKPGQFASGQLPGYINNAVTFKFTNNSSTELDLPSLIVTARSGAEQVCVDVLDADNGYAGAPSEPLAVGASVSFKWGISCPSKSGDDLKITLQVAGVDIYEAKGNLA